MIKTTLPLPCACQQTRRQQSVISGNASKEKFNYSPILEKWDTPEENRKVCRNPKFLRSWNCGKYTETKHSRRKVIEHQKKGGKDLTNDSRRALRKRETIRQLKDKTHRGRSVKELNLRKTRERTKINHQINNTKLGAWKKSTASKKNNQAWVLGRFITIWCRH